MPVAHPNQTFFSMATDPFRRPTKYSHDENNEGGHSSRSSSASPTKRMTTTIYYTGSSSSKRGSQKDSSSASSIANSTMFADFATPVELNLSRFIESRLGSWDEQLNRLKGFVKDHLECEQSRLAMISKHQKYLAHTDGDSSELGVFWRMPLARINELWTEQVVQSVDFAQATLAQVDKVYNEFIQETNSIKVDLDRTLKVQEEAQGSLQETIVGYSSALVTFARIQRYLSRFENARSAGTSSVHLKAAYSSSSSLPPDPWLHERRLEQCANTFLQTKAGHYEVLETLFARVKLLETKLFDTIAGLMTSFINEHIPREAEELMRYLDLSHLEQGWTEGLAKHHLDYEWTLEIHASDAFIASVKALINKHISERDQEHAHFSSISVLQSQPPKKAGLVMRATKGPRSWFAPAMSSAAWSRPTMLILSPCSFLHIYEVQGIPAHQLCTLQPSQWLSNPEILFNPDYSMDLRICEVQQTDFQHGIFTIIPSEKILLSSSSSSNKKQVALRASTGKDMLSWCEVISETIISGHHHIDEEKVKDQFNYFDHQHESRFDKEDMDESTNYYNEASSSYHDNNSYLVTNETHQPMAITTANTYNPSNNVLDSDESSSIVPAPPPDLDNPWN